MSEILPNDNPLAEDLAHVLAHTRELWEAVRGRNIFVTGGTGFFGRWLLESFAHANRSLELEARMTVLSRDPAAFAARAPHLTNDPAIGFVVGNVRTFKARDVAEPRFDFVIHAANESGAIGGREDPLRVFDTIVEGTRAALDFAVAKGAQRFLFTSSGAVYGGQPPEMTHVAEDYLVAPDVSNPSSAYGEGKRAAELLCVCYGQEHGVTATIARCFAFVGPFLPLDLHFAIGNFLRDALAGGPIRVGGDGTPYRSYLHAADLAVWLWTLLLKGQSGRCYNVGSEDDRTIKEMAELVAEIAPTREVQIARAADPAKPAARYIPSCGRAREELSLRQWIDLPSAIRRTLKVLRTTPNLPSPNK